MEELALRALQGRLLSMADTRERCVAHNACTHGRAAIGFQRNCAVPAGYKLTRKRHHQGATPGPGFDSYLAS